MIAVLHDATIVLDIDAKGLLCLLTALAITIAMRRSSAAARHWVWTLAMAALLLLPAATLLLPSLEWRWITHPQQPTQVSRAIQIPSSPAVAELIPEEPKAPVTVPSTSTEQDAPSAVTTPSQPMPEPPAPAPAHRPIFSNLSWQQWLALAYLAGAALSLLPVAIGAVAIRLIARRAHQITSGPWIESFDRMRDQAGLAAPVMLLESDDAIMPMAWGLFSFTLLLPAGVQDWPAERRRVVLFHELAHIKRRDCLTQALAHVACALHWFNPLAWFALRRLRIERERACDDQVLEYGARGSDYAAHLLDCARSLRPCIGASMAALAMARPSQLEGRLLSILDGNRNHRSVSRGILAGSIAAAALLLAPLSALHITIQAAPPAPILVAAAPAAPAPRPATAIEGWKASPDPLPLSWKPKPNLKITIPIRKSFKVARVEGPSPYLALCDHDWPRSQSWLLVDLRTGAFTPALQGNMEFEQAILSNDGQRLAGVGRGRGKENVQVYNLKSGQREQLIEAANSFNFPVIGFLEGDRLLTCGKQGFKSALTVWNIKSGQSEFQVPASDKIEPPQCAISPGGHFFATVSDERLNLYTSTGESAGSAPIPQMEDFKSTIKAVAFSPDGTEVAAFIEIPFHMDKNRIVAWDMATGQVTANLLVEAQKDDRWARKERKFELLPGGAFRFSRKILDRETGKSIFTIPHSTPGKDDDLIHVNSADSVVEVSEPQNGHVTVAAITLSKEEIAKSIETVKAGGREGDSKLPPLTPTDRSNVQILLPSNPAWSVKPAITKLPPATAGAVIRLKDRSRFNGAEVRIHSAAFAAPQARQVAVAYQAGSKSGFNFNVSQTTIDRLSYNGAQIGTLTLPAESDVADLSPDGKLLTLIDNKDRVDVYDTSAAIANHLIALRPYDERDDKANGGKPPAHLTSADDRSLVLAAMIDPTHLLTCSKAGKLTGWKLPECQATFEIQLQLNTTPAINPSHTLVAAFTQNALVLLNPLTGETLGSIALHPSQFRESLSFSPDGSKLACFSAYPSWISVYDLSSGQPTSEFSLSMVPFESSISWAGPNNLVLGRTYLVDLNLRMAIWAFTGDFQQPQPTNQGDDRFWTISKDFDKPQTLLALPLPTPDMRKVIASINPQQNMLVKPGTRITLDANLIGTNPEATRQTILARIADAGLVVADNQSIHLSASVIQKGMHTVDYHRFGMGPGVERVNVPEYVCTLAFTENGQKIWELSSNAGSAPMMVHLKENQTIQDYVNQLNANPGEWFFQTVRIPSYVAKPLEKLNQSRITSSGLAPAGMANNMPK